MRAAESTDDAKALKGTRGALLKSPCNLNATENAKVADLQRANQRIFRAYLLKEGLEGGLRPSAARCRGTRTQPPVQLGLAEQTQALREARAHQ